MLRLFPCLWLINTKLEFSLALLEGKALPKERMLPVHAGWLSPKVLHLSLKDCEIFFEISVPLKTCGMSKTWGRSLPLLQAFWHGLWWEDSGPVQLNLPCSKLCQPWFAFKANSSASSRISELRERKETQNSERTKKKQQQPAGLDCDHQHSDGLWKHNTFPLTAKFSLRAVQKQLLEAYFSS